MRWLVFDGVAKEWTPTKRYVLPLCWLCGGGIVRSQITKDHIIPKCAGGSDRLDNLAPAHGRCNRTRRDRIAASDVRTRRVVLLKRSAWV